MNHEERRAKGRTINNEPSLTDQSQADDTNINVILTKYGVTGVARGTTNSPEWLDHSELPRDLREAFDMAKRATEMKQQLPEKLRNRPLEELMRLTPKEVETILAPPAPTPAPQGEPPK